MNEIILSHSALKVQDALLAGLSHKASDILGEGRGRVNGGLGSMQQRVKGLSL